MSSTASPQVSPLIVGSIKDLHVHAVVEELASRSVHATVFDVASLEAGGPQPATLLPSPGRSFGWIRRLSPAGWAYDVTPSSHTGAKASAWSALITGLVLAAPFEWLTQLPALLAAENKLLQLTTAQRLGFRVPKTFTARSAKEVQLSGLSTVVAKPLGRAHYTDDTGAERIVPAQLVATADLSNEVLAAAPFLLQEALTARNHLRVVTVADRVWVARLDAVGLPLDWRFHEPAHYSFTPSVDHPHLNPLALSLARALSIRYSSQDWIETADGDLFFLDLNPAGQWLFLPRDIAEEVTSAHADFLAQPCT